MYALLCVPSTLCIFYCLSPPYCVYYPLCVPFIVCTFYRVYPPLCINSNMCTLYRMYPPPYIPFTICILHRLYPPPYIFFWIQLKPLRQPVRPICGLMLLYKSIFLILYIVGPYRASVTAGTPFPTLSKRWCSLPEAYGLLVKCNGLELVD